MLNQLNLYGVIGKDVKSIDVKNALDAMDQTQPLLVRIDSEGGSVFEGFSIANALEAYPGPKKIIVDPAAFSIASYIVLMFDDVEIADNGFIMAHLPYMPEGGTSDDMEKNVELLRSIEQKMIAKYSEKTGLEPVAVRALLKRDWYLSSQEAITYNLATSITGQKSATRISSQNKVPLRIYALLSCKAQSGDNCETTEVITMSNAQDAATVEQIEAAYPLMKASTILAGIKKRLPLAAYAQMDAMEKLEEMSARALSAETKVSELESKIAAMEEEMAKAKGESEEDPAAMEEEVDDEEETLAAKAKAKGAKPVARASSSGPAVSAASKWNLAVQAELKPGVDRAKAILAANKKNPGLREQMLAEVNSK